MEKTQIQFSPYSLEFSTNCVDPLEGKRVFRSQTVAVSHELFAFSREVRGSLEKIRETYRLKCQTSWVACFTVWFVLFAHWWFHGYGFVNTVTYALSGLASGVIAARICKWSHHRSNAVYILELDRLETRLLLEHSVVPKESPVLRFTYKPPLEPIEGFGVRAEL